MKLRQFSKPKLGTPWVKVNSSLPSCHSTHSTFQEIMQEVQVRFAPLQSNFSSQVSFFELDASLAVITLGSRTDSRRGRFVTRWCSANDGGGTNLLLERSLHKEIFCLSSSPSISAAAAPDISHSFVTWSKEMTDAAASKLQPTSSLSVKLSTAPHQTIMAICYIFIAPLLPQKC